MFPSSIKGKNRVFQNRKNFTHAPVQKKKRKKKGKKIFMGIEKE
jgi:hypothetical protein